MANINKIDAVTAAALAAAGMVTEKKVSQKKSLKALSNEFRNPIAEKLFADIHADVANSEKLIAAAIKTLEDADTTKAYVDGYNSKHAETPKTYHGFAVEEIRWSLVILGKGKDLD